MKPPKPEGREGMVPTEQTDGGACGVSSDAIPESKPMRRTRTVLLDDCVGSPSVWICWLLKPGDAHLGAVCTTKDRALKCGENIKTLIRFAEHKVWIEQTVLDHSFSYKDSVLAMVQRRIVGD